MADGSVKVNDAYMRWFETSPDSPVNGPLDVMADLTLERLREITPVARKTVYTKGRRFAGTPGFLKRKWVKADTRHDNDGTNIRLVGTRTSRHDGAYPWPYAFLFNPKLYTWNRGGKSIRPANNDLLARAVDEVPYMEFRG